MEKNSTIEPRFFQLFEKLHAGDCSLQELYELEAFFEKEQSVVALKKRMIQNLEDETYRASGHFINDDAFQKIKRQIKQKEQEKDSRSVPLYIQITKIAAVVVLSFVMGGLLVNFLNAQGELDAASYCEIEAPLGAKSRVVLPDSSVVWLNAGSTLRYSTNFSESERNVSLVGEGYFDVAKNEQLPFVVNAHGFLVEVLGTEFNIQAYEDEPLIETVLVEGKVKLNHAIERIGDRVFLTPNSKASFYKNKEDAVASGDPRMVILTNIDPRPLIAWKDDQLIFESEMLKDLVVKLGRKYDYTFEFESVDIENYRFSGALEDETLQQVMDVITTTSPISYEIKGKIVTINKDLTRTGNFKKHLR
ncbi:FecR family protein [uncultured Sunxiuqinia sp.]|uniref:FecR family protein n=1 Tax=uncultured Sunxiuqinia sp. TaxID=1573825 RepID=UPI002AA63753|nr:FecR family protein [uncultured Sunxiuqinia sp.]